MYTQTLTTMPIGSLSPFAENPRYHLNPEGLLAEIKESGLQTPPMVKPDGETIRGNRRLFCLNKWHAEDPQGFNKAFPDGMIPVTVITDATAEEIVELRSDHGQSQQLNRSELMLAAHYLFRNGYPERAVIINLSGLIDQLYPVRPSRAAELHAILHKADSPQVVNQAEYWKAVLAYRHGLLQGWQAFSDCPNSVRAVQAYFELGEVPDGWENLRMPATPFNLGHWKAIAKAMAEDAANNASDPDVGGPAVAEVWSSICDQIDGKIAEATPRAKSMSAKDMKDSIPHLQSEGFQKITAAHAGELSEFTEEDNMLHRCEVLRKHNPKWYADFIKESDKVLNDLRQAKLAEMAPPAKKTSKGKATSLTT